MSAGAVTAAPGSPEAAAARSWAQVAKDGAAYAALRTLLTAPTVAGLGPSLGAARAIGRRFGAAPVNAKRVARAAEHLAQAFPSMTDEAERRELVLRSYEHLAMLAVEIASAPRLITPDGWADHVEIGPMRKAMRSLVGERPVILITAHCGNWEVLGSTMASLGLPGHALYRPLDAKPIDDWVRRTRSRVGLHLVDKFGATTLVPRLLSEGRRVAFVADQNAGDRGMFVPFFGRLTSTYKTLGVMARQYRASLVCGVSRRLGWDDVDPSDPSSEVGARARGLGLRRLGGSSMRYRLEVHDVVTPEEYTAQPDPTFYVTARIRLAIQRMVESAPEQYLWMHRIWKSRPAHERENKPFPPRLRAKLLELPWLRESDVEAIVDRSDRDRSWMAERGTTRLS